MRITSRVSSSFLVVLSCAPLWAACASSDGAGDVTAVDGGERRTTSGSSDGGGASSTTGSGTSGGDAGTEASAISSEAGPGALTVRCGFTETCALPGQICCVALAQKFSCVTGTTCPMVAPNGTAPGSGALACSGTESCGPGLSCCLDVAAGQAVSSCQPSCAAAHAQLCAPFTADPGCPGGGLTCSQSHINELGLSVAYGTCGGVKN